MPVELDRAVHDALGIRASAADNDLVAYARDLWPRHHLAVRAGRVADHRPAAVAWPESTEQVARLCAWCSAEGIALVPYGAGSGVCGAVLPTAATLVVDLKRMHRWRLLDREQGVLTVEAGALGIRLEEELAARALTVGHFPSSILCSTVGGWVAARGAGQCSGRYGKIEDMVAALECVDGRGEVATVRWRANGPDLTPLWIGSEGVLGVITAATLRLHPAAAHRAFLGLSLPDMLAGSEAIRHLYQRGLRPAVCRLYDPFDSLLARQRARRHGARASGRSPGPAARLSARLLTALGARAVRWLLGFPRALGALVDQGARFGSGALLVLVSEGPREQCEAEVAAARAIGRELGGDDLGEGPARHWLAHRYGVSYRQAPVFMLGAFVDTMEVAAPWSRLAGLYEGVRKALGEHALVMAHLSHAYPDGCSIYFTFVGASGDEATSERKYDRAWRDAMQAAIAAGGTLSHHHGVGRSKAAMLGREIGAGVEVVAALRSALDPAGILNPGNLMPPTAPARTPLAPPPARPEVIVEDQLVHAAGAATLAEVEHAAGAYGWTLALGRGTPELGATTVAGWLAAGAPGAPDRWLDPVDHLVAGYSAEIGHGLPLSIRPCPRRAVGPDLYALLHGTGNRCGRIHSAHLRARDPRHRPPRLDCAIDRAPPPDAAEQAFLDRVLGAAGRCG